MPSFLLLFVSSILFGVGNGLAFSTLRVLLILHAPQNYLATAMSVNGTFFGLGQIIVPLIIGLIVGVGGISCAFYVGAGLAITTVFFLGYYIN